MEVPAELFGDFTEKLEATGLNNRVLGKNEDQEIEIEIFYEKDEAEIVDELENYLEEIKEQFYQDEDEDDEDEQDDDN